MTATKITKDASNRTGMHTKIAEPHPIFNKDTNKSNAKANLFTFYNRGKEPKKYNLIYFRNNIVKSFFIHIFILKLFFNQKNAL